MAMRSTRWQADTCGCTVQYEWDDAQSEDVRVHTPTAVLWRCARHAALSVIGTHYSTIAGESRRKNVLLGRLMATLPNIVVANPDGGLEFKAGSVAWAFTAGGALRVTVKPLTGAQRNAAQTWCDTNLGLGAVEVIAG